jgi:predicted NUDIX family NTP pyrophosphohydrolase
MARNASAGLVVYRVQSGKLELLLVHPGGPFWQNRDDGAWSVPKGEVGENEDGSDVAQREFEEELGVKPPQTELRSLGSIRQAGGKTVHAWALRGDLDVTQIRSNTFEMEWPPRSGKMRQFPEVDRAGWFEATVARSKLIPAQREFIDRLEAML